MKKLSYRMEPESYLFLIQPTETQLDYFVKKYHLRPQDYYSLLTSKKDNPYLYDKYELPIEKAYDFAIYEFFKRCVDFRAKPLKSIEPLILVEVPDEWALQQLSNLPIVRMVKKTDKIEKLEEPQPPEEAQEEIEEWHPHG